MKQSCETPIIQHNFKYHNEWRRQWQPTPVLLPGKSYGQRSLVGYSPWGQATVHGVAKSWTGLSGFTFTSHLHALEMEMATHSSVLAWRIPGTGEPGGLPSKGSHRVGHDWSDLASASYFTHDGVLMLLSPLVPLSPSPTVRTSPFSISASPFLPWK